MTDEPFVVRYLCVLDPGCGVRDHSIHCQNLNEQRAQNLRSRERRFRLLQMQEDLEPLPPNKDDPL